MAARSGRVSAGLGVPADPRGGLHSIASRYRLDQRYHLGYLFAERAAEIRLPNEDILFVDDDVYNWRAIDEQAVCASWIGKNEESFMLCRRLLARNDLPDSFLNSCIDMARVGRYLVVNAVLSQDDRATLLERYRFLEFIHSPPGAQFAHIRGQVDGRFWLHLGQDWRFFAPENYIARLTCVLETEPDVFQLAVNIDDATKLTGVSATEDAVRRSFDAGRYLLADEIACGPAMFETARLDLTGGTDGTEQDPIAELNRRAAAAGLRTATLDEVLCITGG